MFRKNNTFENAVKVCGEVIATGTLEVTTATAMTVAGATVATMASGIADASKLPRKTAAAILATAVTAATVTTAVTAKKLGFFKKPTNQQKPADINRQQVETFENK